MIGINLNPLFPVRTEPCEQSELCTQLLFGELFDYDIHDEKWCFIKNRADHYAGFVSRNMVTELSESDSSKILSCKSKILSYPFTTLVEHSLYGRIFMPAGSTFFYTESDSFEVAGRRYQIEETFFETNLSVEAVALQFLNAPYLWGGKSIFGIDCSGFVQVVYSICGRNLPRDASKQVLEGRVVDFLSEVVCGDLAFFENGEGRIVHVGILLDSRHIIHASGCVKVSMIDDYGILQSPKGYSHKLRIIKRI